MKRVMHFGFSYVGLIYLIMLMTPNIIWTKNKPKDYEKYVVNENKVLLAFERAGEVLTTCAHEPVRREQSRFERAGEVLTTCAHEPVRREQSQFERAGEVLTTCAALIFSDFNLRPWSNWSWWLAASFALMILYEIFWIRYFKSDKTMKDYYRSLLGIPVAGATLPVLTFALLAIYGRNIVLGIAILILGIGHIGIHLMHMKECE